ncbi:MAG: hypothetical protein WAR02_01950 [Pseudolabrys sp.]
MHKTQKTTADNKSTRQIQPLCALGATAVAAGSGYGAAHGTTQQRLSARLAYVVNEGRLFALKPSEWSMLLGGVTLCGLLTLLF